MHDPADAAGSASRAAQTALKAEFLVAHRCAASFGRSLTLPAPTPLSDCDKRNGAGAWGMPCRFACRRFPRRGSAGASPSKWSEPRNRGKGREPSYASGWLPRPEQDLELRLSRYSRLLSTTFAFASTAGCKHQQEATVTTTAQGLLHKNSTWNQNRRSQSLHQTAGRSW